MSEDNFIELFSVSTFTRALGLKPRSPGLCGKCLYSTKVSCCLCIAYFKNFLKLHFFNVCVLMHVFLHDSVCV
jgi:hypothetical protein